MVKFIGKDYQHHPMILGVQWNKLQLQGQGSQISNGRQVVWRLQGFDTQLGSGKLFGFLPQSHSGGPKYKRTVIQ